MAGRRPPRDSGAVTDEVAAIAALHEPVRRSLYDYVAAQAHEVGRDEAAEATGVQRNLAAFHLDKLVEAGLLEVSFRRLSGRTGPGAGRPAKLYRRSSSEYAVSLPPRQYDLAGQLLAEAVEEAGDRPARTVLVEVARRFGRRLGSEVRRGLGARASRERRLAALATGLERYGYEPRQETQGFHLANCPFHALSDTHRDLVCGMNLALMEGAVEGVEGLEGASGAVGGARGGIEARRDPRPGQCCVTLVRKAARP